MFSVKATVAVETAPPITTGMPSSPYSTVFPTSHLLAKKSDRHSTCPIFLRAAYHTLRNSLVIIVFVSVKDRCFSVLVVRVLNLNVDRRTLSVVPVLKHKDKLVNALFHILVQDCLIKNLVVVLTEIVAVGNTGILAVKEIPPKVIVH